MENTNIFNVTKTAIDKVKDLIAEENNPNLMLRVFVTGGGCSGFQYGFSFEDKSEDNDTVVEVDNVKFLVDEASYMYLVGSTIDFKEDLHGSEFVIDNPNAVTTCGCGSSFSV